MYKTRLVFVIVVGICPLLFSRAFAQEPSEPDFRFLRASIVSQDVNAIRIRLDIENRSSVSRPDIRYGIQLIRVSDEARSLIDPFVVVETTPIFGNQTTNREIIYPIPAFLSGEYELWVTAEAPGGTILGLVSPGNVRLSGTGEYISMTSDSCYFIVGGESAALLQGVEVSGNEDLTLSCLAENLSDTQLSVVPFFGTFRRESVGLTSKIEYPVARQIVFAPGEKKRIEFTVPKAPVPQLYDVTVALVKEDDMKQVSEKISASYVLHGAGAAIRDFNPAIYSDGDRRIATARFSLGMTGESENPVLNVSRPELFAELSVVDLEGKVCSQSAKEALSSPTVQVTLSAGLDAVCERAVVMATLSDGKGNIFDVQSVKTEDMTIRPAVSNVGASGSVDGNERNPIRAVLMIIGAFALAGLVVLTGYIFWKRKTAGRPNIHLILLLVIFGTGVALNGAWAVTATGGTISTKNSYEIHTFTTSGALSVTNAGTVEVLVVAGGGGAGGGVWGSYFGAGGGTALAKAAAVVNAAHAKTEEGHEFRAGYQTLLRALSEPLRQIAANAGEEDPAVVLNKVTEGKGSNFGYDAAENRYVDDMIKAGIIDPLKVTRTALESAVSVAALLLTTEAAVVDIPEEKGKGGGMPDMSGMGGMM